MSWVSRTTCSRQRTTPAPGRVARSQRRLNDGASTTRTRRRIAASATTLEQAVLRQHYFDSRGVARVYLSLRRHLAVPHRQGLLAAVHRHLRRVPRVITGSWEASSDDGATWEHDFDLTYTGPPMTDTEDPRALAEEIIRANQYLILPRPTRPAARGPHRSGSPPPTTASSSGCPLRRPATRATCGAVPSWPSASSTAAGARHRARRLRLGRCRRGARGRIDAGSPSSPSLPARGITKEWTRADVEAPARHRLYRASVRDVRALVPRRADKVRSSSARSPKDRPATDR